MKVTIIGAGLAGSEAAWQVAAQGIPVELYEMRPQTMTKAHKTGHCAELVCSNSFRGSDLSNAVGLLKEELKILGSLVMEAAAATQVPAGGALAVDRERFSRCIDDKIRRHPLITFHPAELVEIPPALRAAPVIVATGPLTSPRLAGAIEQLIGEQSLAFFDAISPILLHDSIDHGVCFRQSRYDKGAGDDYLNIPLDREQYYSFVDQVARAEKHTGNEEVEADSLERLRPFEGCMPIEDMVERGPDTLRFGPFKPVGLTNPHTGTRPYAVLQLRQDDKDGNLWSMVGMQTRMKRPEQERIFTSLPGLARAEFVRFGSVHRNTFINSPQCLASSLEFRGRPGLFFAGQVTGTEGYVESTAGGLLAGINAARCVRGQEPLTVPDTTAIGALIAYISDPARKDFQPMNVSYGLMPSYLSAPTRDGRGKKLPKKDRRHAAAHNALSIVRELAETVAAARKECFRPDQRLSNSL